jgi:hypothetical protein
MAARAARHRATCLGPYASGPQPGSVACPDILRRPLVADADPTHWRTHGLTHPSRRRRVAEDPWNPAGVPDLAARECGAPNPEKFLDELVRSARRTCVRTVCLAK